MKLNKIFFLLAFLTLTTSPAHAQGNMSFELFAGYHWLDPDGAKMYTNPKGYSFFATKKLNNNVGVEVGYTDYGDSSYVTNSTYDAIDDETDYYRHDALSISLRFSEYIYRNIKLNASIGGAYWNFERKNITKDALTGSVLLRDINEKQSGIDIFYKTGLEFYLTRSIYGSINFNGLNAKYSTLSGFGLGIGVGI